MTQLRRALPAGVVAIAWWLSACTGVIDGGARGGTSDPAPESNGPSGGATSLPKPPGASTFTPGPLRWHRLTTEQLRHALVDVFGPDVPTYEIEPDQRIDGFASIGASRIATSHQGVEKLEQLATAVARHAVSATVRTRLFPCMPSGPSVRTCAESSLRLLGRLLFHRPVDDTTVAGLATLADDGARTLGDPWAGFELAVGAMLQSPRFLYVLERAEPRPNGGARLDAHSIAGRLALLLTNAPPDAALLDAADGGELANAAGIERVARRLMQQPRFRQSMRTFATSMLELQKLAGRAFDRTVFPKASETLAASALEETLRFFEHHFVDRASDYLDLFTTRTTFVNAELARVYDVSAPSGGGFSSVDLPSSARRFGLLTQASFLAAASPPNEANTIARGRAVRENLLCQRVADPPADLNPQLPPVVPGRLTTKRERLQAHRMDPSCAACHRDLDPPGLALENYDGIGGYRTQDHGLELFIADELDGVRYDDVAGFAAALRGHPKLAPCLATKLHSYALGRSDDEQDQAVLGDLHAAFAAGDRRLVPLIVRLVTHDGFSHVAPPVR